MSARPSRRAYRAYGGQTVDAVVLRRFLFLYLASWRVRRSWDGSPPFTEYTKTAWRPCWRFL